MIQLIRKTVASPTSFFIVGLSMLGLLLVLTLFYLASSRINEVLLDAQELAQHRYPKSRFIQRATQEDLLSNLLIRDITVYADSAERDRLLDAMRRHEESANSALAELTASTKSVEGIQGLTLLQAARQKLSAAKAEVIVAVEERLPAASDRVAILKPPLEQLRRALLDYVATAEDLQELHSHRVLEMTQESIENAEWIRRWLVAGWSVGGGILIAVGIFWRRIIREDLDERDKRIQRVIENRDTLVREVHHRIKNHLQGVLGLIEDCQSRRPEVSADLTTLHGHVLSLAAVHGLQARFLSEDILLKELLDQQVALLRRSDSNLEIVVESDSAAPPIVVASGHAVPLALALTELIINANKHGQGPIAVRQWVDSRGPHVSISNTVAHVVKLDIDSEAGFGTGLSLVKSMLIDIGELSVDASPERFTICVSLFPAHMPKSNEENSAR